MAKTKLTNEQLRELASTLRRNVRANVYSLAASRFGAEVGEEVFDELLRFDVFKCDNCEKWLILAEKSESGELCRDCTGGGEWEDDFNDKD